MVLLGRPYRAHGAQGAGGKYGPAPPRRSERPWAARSTSCEWSPDVRQSRLQWLTNADDQTREQAEGAAPELGRGLPSKETESTAGDSDPLVAVQDALREFAADEVVVVTHPDEEASWLEEGKGRAIVEELHGVTVTESSSATESRWAPIRPCRKWLERRMLLR